MKNAINEILSKTESDIKKISEFSPEAVTVTEYGYLVKEGVWTDAFQKAIDDNEYIYIPYSDTPYIIDHTVTIPSDRHIKAEHGAVIRLAEGTDVLMIRNRNNTDGTNIMPSHDNRDKNISITGGRWEETHTVRAGYQKSGKYDGEGKFFGVSCCMLFNNVENLYLSDVTIVRAGGFAVQIGEIKNAVFENITFESCFADGLHINGNSENIIARNIKGHVGDDLVALNMYDWQNSSVTFGPGKNILCENLELSADSKYKSLRILPGMYYFDDGTSVDCSLENVIIKNVKGIKTFKIYFQTPPYMIGSNPERGDIGSVNNIFFEDIDIELDEPIDKLNPYLDSDMLRGSFASFETGSRIGNISLENIRVNLNREKWPLSYFLCDGPKSVILGKNEVFNPYVTSVIENLTLSDISVNGRKVEDITPYIREIEFRDVNNDGNSTGRGVIKNIICK